MGLYDTVLVPCPACGENYPAQTKSGPCELAEYALADAPFEVLLDVNRHAPFRCGMCDTQFHVSFAPMAVKDW